MTKVRDYKNHKEAAAYLNEALRDENPRAFLLALRTVAEAQGGMSQLAQQSELNRENLYRTLSLKGNPRFFNLLAVLKTFHLELFVRPKKNHLQDGTSD